jgi:archaellum biogenesis ATPase FlaH
MNYTKDDITLEASLLKTLAIKKHYDQFINVLDAKRLIPTTANLLKDYKKYYDKYSTDIDFNVFYGDFSQTWHRRDMNEHDLKYYRDTVFPLIESSTVDQQVYVTLLEREAAHKINELTNAGVDNIAIQEVLSELQSKKSAFLHTKDEDIFSLSELNLDVLDTSNGLEWFMPSIQAGLNSMMPGQFIVVAADSDTGKSAFCISQAAHTFRQMNRAKATRPILYCTSEDTKEDLAARFLSCLYRDEYIGGFEQIVSEYSEVLKRYKKEYNDKLFVGMQIRSSIDFIKIKQKIEKFNPCLIIIDMLDKLSNSDNIQDLTQLYQGVRAIANDGYSIIGTSQSGNTSYQDRETGEYKHRKWLTDKDLANSKSGKQGAAYCMIMIGRDDEIPNVRYISTTKKKRGKHVALTCEILQEYSLYKELL